MGNFFDKLFNGPLFNFGCVPKCTPDPRNNGGIVCYKGKCVP